MSKKLIYSLPPYLTPEQYTDDATIIDLNSSDDFSIVCDSGNSVDANHNAREKQLQSLDFIKKNPEPMNLIAHFLAHLNTIKDYSYYDLNVMALHESILNGTYGDIVSRFFLKPAYRLEQERMMYYFTRKKQDNNRVNDFEAILSELFPDGVTFYYDKYKRLLYVAFVAEETAERREIYEVCQYLFADILMNICVRWNTFPLIIGSRNCMIAAEGSQRCSSLL